MKYTLLSKINEWNLRSALKFHNNKLDICREDNQYIWEHIPEGVLLYRKNSATIFTTDGYIHKISNIISEQDWILLRKLYSISDNVEEPVHFEFIDGTELKYLIVRRPYNELGLSMFEVVMLGRMDIDWFDNYINGIVDISKKISSISNIYPVPPKMVTTREGYIWSDFKHWKYSKKEYVKSIYEGIEFSTRQMVERDVIMNKVEVIWKI